MFTLHLIKFLIFLNSIQISFCFLSESKQNLIKSFNKELDLKHLSIIKDLDFKINQKILFFIKRLSRQNVYSSFLSVNQMNYFMNEYYDSRIEKYLENRGKENVADNKINHVYPPKTMIILHGKNLKEILKIFFHDDNEFPVSKFIWLIVDDFNESYLNSKSYYIPYNSLLLLLKNATNNENGYFIKEFYHPSLVTISGFILDFGFWDKENGLKINEFDIYKRRLNMNGTAIQAYYFEEDKNYIHECESLIRQECQIVKQISQILNFKLVISAFEPKRSLLPWDIELQYYVMNYINYYPNFIGPIDGESVYIYIAYDESYKEHGISLLLNVFSLKLWLAIAAWIGTSVVLIIIVQCCYRKKKIIPKNYFWDYLFEPFESFLNQSAQDPPQKFPFLAITLSTRFAALFIVPAYTGALLSFILLSSTKLPFNDLKEFAEDGSYRLGYMKDFFSLKQYAENSYDLHLKKIYQELSTPINGTYEKALLEGVKNMCKDHKFAFTFYELIFRRQGCTAIKIPYPITTGWIVLRTRYRSPYVKIFNRIFKTMRSSGVFRRMVNDQYKALGRSSLAKNPNQKWSQDEDVEIEVKISSLGLYSQQSGSFTLFLLLRFLLRLFTIK